VVQILHTMQLL